MKITGIVMECNPFHAGHRYLLQRARLETQADRIVVVMSGNFVQRGAPAIINKETRAKQVLENGADLVLELPLYTACAGADFFARGSIALLENLGCVDTVCFGSESGDAQALLSAAGLLLHEDGSFREALQEGLRSGLNYPQARSRAAEKIFHTDLPSAPNDLLATEYCKAIKACRSRMRVHAVRRISAPSASQLRDRMLQEDAPETGPDLPPELSSLLSSYRKDHQILSADSFSQALLSSLIRAVTDRDLTQYLDVSRELAGRIRRNLPYFRDFSSFCDIIKTRNVTHTRVSRALTHILLGMTDSEMRTMQQHGMCPYAKPLGFRKDAADLLRAVSQAKKVPFLSRLSQAKDTLSPDVYALLRRELAADMLYDLTSSPGCARSAFQKPLIIF